MHRFPRLTTRTRLLSLGGVALSAFILCAGVVQADFSLVGPPPVPTLARALAALTPPREDLFLTVGADKVTLPPGVDPPGPDSHARGVGAAYGCLPRDFGGVTALAPPEMVVLNTRPGVPYPFSHPPAAEALTLLLADLTNGQWEALTGTSGLGAADLITDSQRVLFFSALPGEGVRVSPHFGGAAPDGAPATPIRLTAAILRGARLRLRRQTLVFIPVQGATHTLGGDAGRSADPFDGQRHYEISSTDPLPPQNVAEGAALRLILPNTPKDADLDYNAAPLTRSVRLDGIATVGDLVARVGQTAGLELYADHRYEMRRVTLVGHRTARGVDLLRSVAFCVTGTFRRVGPAYVLTDDLQGTFARRFALGRFQWNAEMQRHAAEEAAGDNLLSAHGGLEGLPPLDDRGMSRAEAALPEQQSDGLWGMVSVPFAQLTPAQQEYAADQVRQSNAAADESEGAGGGRGQRLTLAGTIFLSSHPVLVLQSPAVPGPIFLNADSLYQISLKSRKEKDRRQREEDARRPSSAPPRPLPPVAALLDPLPRRAALAAPRTAHEVDRVVAEMKTLGLNQLWLDVFTGGHSRLDAPEGGGPDILTEALARTKGTGITVIPALDLLRWGADVPPALRDLTAMGETSAQQQAWAQHRDNIMQDVPDAEAAQAPPAAVWVSPGDPAVQKTLLTLVRRLAALPGVTTLALHGTVPPGYFHQPPPNGEDSDDALGYVATLRLALLRRAHVDPLDLDLSGASAGSLALPEFDDPTAVLNARVDWNRLRDGVSRDLLRRLLAAAQDTSGRRFRFLVESRGGARPGAWEAAAWYGLWDNPSAPLPEFPSDETDPGRGLPPWKANYAPVAHSQCRIVFQSLPLWILMEPVLAADALRARQPGWDGVVLDTTAPVPIVPGGDLLAALIRCVTPPEDLPPRALPPAPSVGGKSAKERTRP